MDLVMFTPSFPRRIGPLCTADSGPVVGVTFDPSSLITGAGGFYRADVGVTHSGASISNWADQSLFSNDLNTTDSTPAYSATGFNSSFPGITFSDNTGQNLYRTAVTWASASTASIFFLMNYTQTNGVAFGRFGALINGGGADFNNPGSFETDDTNVGTVLESGSNNAQQCASGTVSTGIQLVGAVYDGTHATFFVNGTGGTAGSQTGGPFGGAGGNLISVGRSNGTSGACAGMILAFFGITQRVLTAGDWANLKAWSNANWGTSL
jgi:hypothetical protein